MTLLKRFYQYQNERFPIRILFFTTLAVVLSSAAVLSYSVSWQQVILNLLATLVFLYHIRVIDESRDLEHDNQNHPTRPVQRGLISLKELFIIDFLFFVIFIITSILYGVPSKIYGAALLVFSFLAWKDFFGGAKLKNQFYLYNGINMLQMVLLQLFIYAVFTNSFQMSRVMWIHLLFVVFNTVIMEIVRKIKSSDEEDKGKDTYSWHLGYARSLYMFYFFSLINYITFIWMMYTISPHMGIYLVISIVLFLLLSVASFTHLFKKKKRTENLLLLSTVVSYVGLNLLIYFYNI